MRAKSNRFTSYAVAKAFYKKLGKPYRAKYLEASLNLRAGSKVCNRLSSFRFKTKGVVAFALSAKKSSTSSKSVRATATAEPIGGLYGIDEEGVATPVISAVDGSAVTLADATAIEKVYTAPDGSVITRYSAHPDKCLIGKVAVGATLEECIVTSSDLPQGFGIGDGGGAAVETTDVVQFDAVGNMYLNIFGLAPQCQQPGTSFAGEGLAQVAADGTVTVFANETCLSQVYSWAPLRTGGVVYLWKPDFNDYRGSLNVWEDGIISTLKKDLITTADGIHTMADGRTLINVSSSGDEVFPGPSRDQGGMLLYTEKAGVATTWYHLAS